MPAFTSSSIRSFASSCVEMEAPTMSCFFPSFEEFGYSRFFRRSFRHISETRLPSESTMGSLPFFDFLRMSFASLRRMPCRAVSRSVVITSESFLSLFDSKSTSRLVTIPTSREPSFPLSVTGIPEKPYRSLIPSTSRMVFPGERTIGSLMKPFSKRFTFRTSLACSSMVLL